MYPKHSNGFKHFRFKAFKRHFDNSPLTTFSKIGSHIKKGISCCEHTEHFLHNKPAHNFDNNMIITVIEQIRKDNISNKQKKDLLRHREILWQKKLNSMQPNRLNKRIG